MTKIETELTNMFAQKIGVGGWCVLSETELESAAVKFTAVDQIRNQRPYSIVVSRQMVDEARFPDILYSQIVSSLAAKIREDYRRELSQLFPNLIEPAGGTPSQKNNEQITKPLRLIEL
jgi:hypothetical protein